MVVLRATAKVMKSLQPTETAVAESDTALGDWYVNRIVIARRPLLLLVSSKSLLSIVVPARDVRGLPTRLAGLVEARLERMAVPREWVRAEVDAMTPTLVAKTANRSVLGVMVDFAKVAPYHQPADGWTEAWLPELEIHLAETPCFVTRALRDAIYPLDEAARLLAERWAAAGPNRASG